MPAGQKFPWILDWRGLPGRAPGAAEVLSLVFCWRPPVCAGGVLAEKGKPSLAEVLSLGLSLFGTSRGSGELELQLSTRAAGVNVPMACAAEVLSLVSGLWPPVLNETKLRENATNNPGQRCTCSNHGLSLAGMSAPGDLGQQILKTMLRRYEALDGVVALSLSKRGAHLLSMVFYAKAANPQELVAIEMGNQT